MSLSLPGPQRKWVQMNASDVLGNLFTTFGVDLTWNNGTIRSGDATLLNINSTDVTALTRAIGFRSFAATGINSGNKTIFTVAGGVTGTSVGAVFYANNANPGTPNTTFVQDATSGTPTTLASDIADIELSGLNLYVAGGGKVYELTPGGTWNNYNITGDTGNGTSVHMMTNYAGRLYVTRLSNQIISADTTGSTLGSFAVPTAQYSLALTDTSLYITWLRASSNRIWIGTVNPYGGKGYVFEWDGASTQVTKSYRLDSSGALACVIKDDIPYIMNTNAELQVWNGGTFKNLDDAGIGVPGQVNRLRGFLFQNALSTYNNRFIHPNGMSLVDGNIHILLDTRNSTSTLETDQTNPAGIWEYDPQIGLYHKYGLTYTHSTDTILADGGQIKLGKNNDTSTGIVGGLSEMHIASNAAGRNGSLMCGSGYVNDAGNLKYGIWYDDLNKTFLTPGYITTTRIYSQNVNEVWQKLFLVFRRFFDVKEEISVKYSTVDNDPLEATITWTSNTTFTTTSDLSIYSVGDEVQPIQGQGSGIPCHITALSLNAGTWTVTVDRYYPGVTGSSVGIVWFQKWTKLLSTTDSTVDFKEIQIGVTSKWIRFKIWFNFIRYDEIEELLIASIPAQKIQ